MSALEGSHALITGAAGGLGRAIAAELAAAGVRLTLVDSRSGALEQAAAALPSGSKVSTCTADLCDGPSLEPLIHAVETAYGPLDILVNNAGTDVTAPVDDLSLADVDRILDVNLRAPFLLARALFPLMRERGGGQVVNIVSTAAKRAWPNASAYHASKWGLLGLSHALHAEGRAEGIRVTAIIAGGMQTPFLLDRFPDIDTATLMEPAHVAEAVLFALTRPAGATIPELTVTSPLETSWP
jgi:NAD(P)-dependent dehydrogenase (short-subunit alcohol dehydrogenase family)